MKTYSAREIQDALDQFSPKYHSDFRKVRTEARRWLDGRSEEPPESLIKSLEEALRSWGAGRRLAPRLAGRDKISTTLRSLRREAAKISRWSFEDAAALQTEHHRLLCQSLDTLRGLFVQATQVTYPSKALMLITGRVVGLDSNVRNGLRRWGYYGFYNLSSCDSRQRDCKVFQALVIAASWYKRQLPEITVAMRNAPQYLADLDSPGRIVDVVLFREGIK